MNAVIKKTWFYACDKFAYDDTFKNGGMKVSVLTV